VSRPVYIPLPLFTHEPPRLRVAEDLARVRAAAGPASVPLAQLVRAGGDRGFALVLVVATIPFVLPFPTLGLATPVGFALALAALGMMAGRPAALPRRLGALRIGPVALARAHAAAERASRVLAQVSRPRLRFMLGGPAGRSKVLMRAGLGLSLFTAAVALGLPVPLPLSNFVPATAILLLATGVLEEDGLLVLAGHAATLAVCGVVAGTGGAIVAAGARVLAHLR
jgi:hypothetical protein